jgi:hypothetical protein
MSHDGQFKMLWPLAWDSGGPTRFQQFMFSELAMKQSFHAWRQEKKPITHLFGIDLWAHALTHCAKVSP